MGKKKGKGKGQKAPKETLEQKLFALHKAYTERSGDRELARAEKATADANRRHARILRCSCLKNMVDGKIQHIKSCPFERAMDRTTAPVREKGHGCVCEVVLDVFSV